MNDNGLGELAKAIECLLFASAEPLSEQRLSEVLDAPAERVEGAVAELRASLAERGLQVVQLAGGYQLATRPQYAAFVHKLLQPPPARLSAQALEALAIIAYRQPVTRPEVDAVRGVNSQHALASLTEKGLVTTVGRRDAPGRPVLYATTPHFLSTFGLKDLGELPSLEQLRQAIGPQEPITLPGVGPAAERDAERDVSSEAMDAADREAAEEARSGAADGDAEADEGVGPSAPPE